MVNFKKSLKNVSSKFQKIPNSTFVKTIDKKIQEKLEKFQKFKSNFRKE